MIARALLLILLLCSAAYGQVVPIGRTIYVSQQRTDKISFSYERALDIETKLVPNYVTVTVCRNADQVSAVSDGAVRFTQTRTPTTSDLKVATWHLPAPALGKGEIVISFKSVVPTIAIIVTFAGVNPLAPVRVPQVPTRTQLSQTRINLGGTTVVSSLHDTAFKSAILNTVCESAGVKGTVSDEIL